MTLPRSLATRRLALALTFGLTLSAACSSRSGFGHINEELCPGCYGECSDSADCAEGYVCQSHACELAVWTGIGGSDIGTMAQRIGGSSWGGGISNSAAGSRDPAIVIDSAGNPIVAWAEGGEIYVQRFDGASWVEVGPGSASGGGISNTGGGSSSPALAIDATDNLVVAWAHYSTTLNVYVRRFDGAAWTEVGTGSASGTGIGTTALWEPRLDVALDAAGNPTVAWVSDLVGNTEICVRQFDGANWVELGTGSGSGGGISNNPGASVDPSIAFDGTGHPVVAWSDDTAGNDEIYVLRFDGAAWSELGTGSASGGGVSNNAGNSWLPTLRANDAGDLWLVWGDATPTWGQIFVKRFDGGAWVESNVGSASGTGISNTEYASDDPALAFDAAGRPVVASGGSEIFASRFDGSTWQEAGVGSASGGGISDNWGRSQMPSIAVDSSDRITVAWEDDTSTRSYGSSGAGEIYIKRLEAGAWHDLWNMQTSGGGLSNDSGASLSPAVQLDSRGYPVVAWQNIIGETEDIYVRRYDGSAWQEVGAGSASGGGITNSADQDREVALALTADDRPIVAWENNPGGGEDIFVLGFDGTSWGELGAGSASDGGLSGRANWSNRPSIAVASTGHPVVAWSEHADSFAFNIYVLRFDGTSWVELGVGSASGQGISPNSGAAQAPSVALDSRDRVVVAWVDDAYGSKPIFVRRFNGESWTDVGTGSSSGEGISGSLGGGATAIAIDAHDHPVVAWAPGEVYVRRFDGTSWRGLDGSDSGRGISVNAGASYYPTLALDDAGNPIVAWSDDTPGQTEVYVKRYLGGRWIELGTGSATGGGISNSGGESGWPSLSVRLGTACVAWAESAPSSPEVVLRCAPL